MVLRERSAALDGSAANGPGQQPVEQSLVDLLSQGLPPGHPDTDLVAMIMSEVRTASFQAPRSPTVLLLTSRDGLIRIQSRSCGNQAIDLHARKGRSALEVCGDIAGMQSAGFLPHP